MIRSISQRPVGKIFALVAALSVVSAGSPPLFAATISEESKSERSAPAVWWLQVLNGRGEVVDFEKTLPTSSTPPSRPELPANIAEVQLKLQTLEKNADPKTSARATRLLRWLDIAAAKTAAERHEKIRKLPVTVSTEPARGRDGLVKKYAINGKVRMQRFVPSLHSAAPIDLEPSGPAVWEDCYENEPEPCATVQEMEDYDIVLAQTQYELELAESDNNVAQGEYVTYCNNTPWAEICQQQEPDIDQPLSGPSVCEIRASCFYKAAYATEWVAVGLLNLGFRVVARAGAAAMGKALSAAAVAASTAALVASAFMAGWYVGSFIDCLLFQGPELDTDFDTAYAYDQRVRLAP